MHLATVSAVDDAYAVAQRHAVVSAKAGAREDQTDTAARNLAGKAKPADRACIGLKPYVLGDAKVEACIAIVRVCRHGRSVSQANVHLSSVHVSSLEGNIFVVHIWVGRCLRRRRWLLRLSMRGHNCHVIDDNLKLAIALAVLLPHVLMQVPKDG